MKYTIVTFYRFVLLSQFESLQESLRSFCQAKGIKGTILLAKEGINGTVAGSQQAIDELVKHVNELPHLKEITPTFSQSEVMPFKRMKVKLKREIVTMGLKSVDPLKEVGTYVDPRDWNKLISSPDTVVIDTRNDYETSMGIFKGAVNPNIKTFQDFPNWLKENRQSMAKKKVAMYCTGGIRCEKATSFAREIGLEEVYHLQGGILQYLMQVPQSESLWSGDCFVFDERVSVGENLEPGHYELCRACRRPIEAGGKFYQEGVSCAYCYHEKSDSDRKRFASAPRANAW